MERVSAKALAYGGFFVLLASMMLSGVALLAMGAQAGLSARLGDVGSMVAVGAAFTAAPLGVFIASLVRSNRKSEPEDSVVAALRPAALRSSVGMIAKTAFVGLAARRPLAALGLATLVSVARSSLVESRRPVQPAE